MFYNNQDKELKYKYNKYLELMGAFSNLFAESRVPYLDYRVAENLFCLAFQAENLSRLDISIDALKANTGIGLKTFLHNNGKTFQKIAEFNALRKEFENKSPLDIINIVANARNRRIETTLNLKNIENIIYHCVTRSENNISIHECPMDLIDISKIRNIKTSGNSIKFDDHINEYNFNLSKSVLMKRFCLEESIMNIHIRIIENPYDLLLNFLESIEYKEATIKATIGQNAIYLPLYSEKKELKQFLKRAV